MNKAEFLQEKNLKLLGIRDLRKLAFSIGVYGYTKYSKSELIEHIIAVISGSEPPKTEIGKGRPSAITQDRKEVFDNIILKLKNAEQFSFPSYDLPMVASNTNSYDTGRNNKTNCAVMPSKQLILSDKALAPINVFAPIAYGSRILVSGSVAAVAKAKELLYSALSSQNTLLLLPDESPEEILQAKSTNAQVFATTFGDTAQETILTSNRAFKKATAISDNSPIIFISSISKLAKSFNNLETKTIGSEDDLPEASISAIKKLCLSACANKNGSSVTLIAFCENSTTLDKACIEALRSAFSGELILDEALALSSDLFPLDIKASYSKFNNFFQDKKLAIKQKEIRANLISEKIDNKSAIELA